ncbi:MAG: amidohydrolase [Bacteroidota bacterium]
MKRISILIAIWAIFSISTAWQSPPPKVDKLKEAVVNSIKGQSPSLIKMSDQIWAFAETALAETQSAALLADYAQEQGFAVERGVAEMPTAFVASYGEGEPIIGILGEFDALPGLSQQASSDKTPLENGKPGHGCGHNMFGVASLGAAVAIKEQIEKGKLKGTIRFYGTPAEETIGGKLYMARAGLFDDLDICLDWHPSASTSANTQSSKALIDFRVKFYGKAAHASADPWNGVSAVDAMEFYTSGLNYLREHLHPTVRIHYLFEKAGDVVNVVPENAQIWTRLRDSKMEDVKPLYERVKKIAEGAAMMAGAEYEIELISGMHEIIPNRTGAAALQANLEALGAIQYSEEEIEFAKEIQIATNKEEKGLNSAITELKPTREHPQGGSTDVGDVSWIVPQISLRVTTAPEDTPWHSWAVVACGGMSIGHKGMNYAANALSMTMVDLFTDPALREEMKAEFRERKGDKVYQAVLPEGPPPVPSMN